MKQSGSRGSRPLADIDIKKMARKLTLSSQDTEQSSLSTEGRMKRRAVCKPKFKGKVS
jgi:hypothetical protein